MAQVELRVQNKRNLKYIWIKMVMSMEALWDKSKKTLQLDIPSSSPLPYPRKILYFYRTGIQMFQRQLPFPEIYRLIVCTDFILADCLDLVHAGMEAIIEDEVTQ